MMANVVVGALSFLCGWHSLYLHTMASHWREEALGSNHNLICFSNMLFQNPFSTWQIHHFTVFLQRKDESKEAREAPIFSKGRLGYYSILPAPSFSFLLVSVALPSVFEGGLVNSSQQETFWKWISLLSKQRSHYLPSKRGEEWQSWLPWKPCSFHLYSSFHCCSGIHCCVCFIAVSACISALGFIASVPTVAYASIAAFAWVVWDYVSVNGLVIYQRQKGLLFCCVINEWMCVTYMYVCIVHACTWCIPWYMWAHMQWLEKDFTWPALLPSTLLSWGRLSCWT